MLVLSRKAGESIRISEDITVKVIERRGRRVRLAIDAPKDVDILRGELIELRKPLQDCDVFAAVESL